MPGPRPHDPENLQRLMNSDRESLRQHREGVLSHRCCQSPQRLKLNPNPPPNFLKELYNFKLQKLQRFQIPGSNLYDAQENPSCFSWKLIPTQKGTRPGKRSLLNPAPGALYKTAARQIRKGEEDNST
ncbi:UNVERIFIED_CONTAM: hypothetical protein K2H54_026936 [Gekko kuhli]